jgi:hypothetical protein
VIDSTGKLVGKVNPILIAIEIATDAFSRHYSFCAAHPNVTVTAIVIGLDYGSLPAKFYETENSVSIREFSSTFIPPQKRVNIARLAKHFLAELLVNKSIGNQLTMQQILEVLTREVRHNLQNQFKSIKK